MARRLVYRDYSPGSAGQFTSKEKFETSELVYREYVGVPDDTIASIDELYEYEDYEEYDVIEEEYHATGQTGRTKK